MENLLLLMIGLFAGMIGGALGLGGGFILVPVFHTILRWPLLESVAVSQFCVVAASVSAAPLYIARGQTALRLGIILESATIIGAAGGAMIAAYLAVPVVAVMFAVVGGLVAVRMWIPTRGVLPDRPVRSPARNLPWGLTASVLVGSLASVLGIGGGVLKVPILNLVMRVPLRQAVGTSAFMVGLTAATSAIVYYTQGVVLLAAAAPVVLGVLIGSKLGAVSQEHLPVRLLRRAFSVLLFALALRMALEALGW